MHTTQPGRWRQVSRKILAGVGRCQEKFWQVLASGMHQYTRTQTLMTAAPRHSSCGLGRRTLHQPHPSGCAGLADNARRASGPPPPAPQGFACRAGGGGGRVAENAEFGYQKWPEKRSLLQNVIPPPTAKGRGRGGVGAHWLITAALPFPFLG